MTTRIPVMYDARMSVEHNPSFAPSAGKPQQVVEDWVRRGLAIDLLPFEPLSRSTLMLAHSPTYVDGIASGAVPNGFGNKSPSVAASLRWTTGSLLAACEHVLQQESLVACSPTSGFHHAQYDSAHGYCTFNGLIVAAMALKRDGFVKRVGIIDCDYHFGDGTAALIERHGLGYVEHFTCGAKHHEARQAEAALRATQHAAEKIAAKVDLIIYQAGADPHINDPLGGLLTTEQMRERDSAVFAIAREAGVPLVWNLAGGYQRDANGTIEPVLALHRQTMEVCAQQYGAMDGRT